jgi:hypothetical protein
MRQNMIYENQIMLPAPIEQINYISEGSMALLRCNIIYENCWRYHLANPHLAKRDCLSHIRQSPNAGLECLVNDVYSNKARR